LFFCIYKLVETRDLPSSNTAASVRLELDDDIGQFEVSFFFQVGQHSGTEEHFALTDAVQVGIKLQRFNLHRKQTLLFI